MYLRKVLEVLQRAICWDFVEYSLHAGIKNIHITKKLEVIYVKIF